MGFEEVLIHFFDRISRVKKVKSRLNCRENFGESTIGRTWLLMSKARFRFPFLRSRKRIINGDNTFLLASISCYVLGNLPMEDQATI